MKTTVYDLKAIQKICPGLKRRSAKDSLRCFDYEHNGFISPEELKFFSLTTRGEGLSEKEVDKMLRDMALMSKGCYRSHKYFQYYLSVIIQNKEEYLFFFASSFYE